VLADRIDQQESFLPVALGTERVAEIDLLFSRPCASSRDLLLGQPDLLVSGAVARAGFTSEPIENGVARFVVRAIALTLGIRASRGSPFPARRSPRESAITATHHRTSSPWRAWVLT